jgi:hypothetical protein
MRLSAFNVWPGDARVGVSTRDAGSVHHPARSIVGDSSKG